MCCTVLLSRPPAGDGKQSAGFVDHHNLLVVKEDFHLAGWRRLAVHCFHPLQPQSMLPSIGAHLLLQAE